MDLKKFDTFLFDLDGTLWRVSKLLPGAKELVKKLRKMKKKVYFVTNSNTFTRKYTAKQLTRLGIPAKEEDVINTGYVLSVYLKKRNATVMAFGDGLIEELKLNGVKVRKKPPVDYVTVGDDLDFHFDKISLGMQAIEKGARLIVATMARTWKIGDRLVPG